MGVWRVESHQGTQATQYVYSTCPVGDAWVSRYGREIIVTFEAAGEQTRISVTMDSAFARDIAQKLMTAVDEAEQAIGQPEVPQKEGQP